MKKDPRLPSLLSKALPLVYGSALILTLLIIYAGYSASRQISEAITHQFNQQQLILARKISGYVQNQTAHLQAHLLSLRNLWEMEGAVQPDRANRIMTSFKDILGRDVLTVLALDSQGRLLTWVGERIRDPNVLQLPETESFVGYLRDGGPGRRVWVGRTREWEGKWVLPLAVPFREPGGKGGKIGGLLVFLVDALRMAQKADEGVVSGSSGYPWIINSQGIFMDHFDPGFVGRNIFVVRGLKNPNISYQKIDDLTRNELLRKKEGTSTYVTGWHREKIAVTQKLVAYTPIPFFETPDRSIPAAEFWSVAVVAPVEEVSGLVRRLTLYQIFLFGVFQLIVIFSTGLFAYVSSRWSRYLKVEVEQKTEELRKWQEKLIHAERLAAIGSMASRVSHEIKNPLIAIGGLAAQLKRSPHLGEKEKGKLEIITSEIQRLEKLLLDVRDFTRPTTPKKVPASIRTVVEEVLMLFAPMFGERHIEVKTAWDPGLSEFCFDPDQIKQVLMNLIKNAVEAMPEGGVLTLSTQGDPEWVRIRIADTGKGIDPEIRDQLFRPFISKKETGTGLGLAVSYKLVQDHNGDIRVDSSEKGTTMEVILPRTEKPGGNPQEISK
jgi:signal transduction histidine kinase